MHHDVFTTVLVCHHAMLGRGHMSVANRFRGLTCLEIVDLKLATSLRLLTSLTL